MFLDEVSQTDPLLLQQVRADCQKLMELKFQMEMAEEAFKEAQKAYSDFATRALPQQFKDCGLESLSTSEGVKLVMTTKTRASIKKGTDDGRTSKASICKWLREHDCEYLIKEQLIVPQSQLEAVKKAGIIFEEDVTVNTSSLKVQIMDMLGQRGSPAIINKDDLPEGLSFYQWEEIEVQ